MKQARNRLLGLARVGSLLLALALVISVTGCPPKGKPSPTATPTSPVTKAKPAPTGEPIEIGAIFSVTGDIGAPLGDPEKKTVELLVEQVNNNGGVLGRPLSVTIKDDKSDSTEARLAAVDLDENKKVVAIIGPSLTPTTMPVKDYCQQKQLPLVSCAAGKVITSPVASYVFAVPQTNTLAVDRIFDYVVSQKINKVALIYLDNDFGKDGRDNVNAIAKQRGVTLVASESFGAKDTDMTAQLTRIKAKSPQAILCWATGPGPAIVTANAKTLGINVPIFQSHGVANLKFIEGARDAANGVMLPAGRLIVYQQIPDTDPQKKVLSDFASAYKAKYGADPNTFAGHASDAFWLVVNAIEKAGSTDRVKVRDAIEATKDFVGTAGIFNYSPTDHNGLTKDAFVWVKIVDGKWKLEQ